MSIRRLGLSSLLLLSVSACSLIPDYHRPDSSVAPTWPAGPAGQSAGAIGGATAGDLGWSQFFTDPVAQDLIRLALENNRNLRVAALNVQSAEAQYGVDRASLFPAIDANAGYEASKTPGDTVGTTGQQNVREYSLGAEALSWELDLFGAIRSKAKSAKETAFANEQTAIGTQLTLEAEVVSEYLAWLADRQSLAVAQDTVKSEADSVRLTQLLLANGTDTALDEAQAEVTLRTAQASVAQYQRAVAEDMDELVLLVGAPIPGDVEQRMEAVNFLSDEPTFPALSAGVPSDLLARRPDIRAAEHTLLAANANVGAARAAFFPSITLTASGGRASSALNNLFGAGQGSWLFEPQVSVPIFNAGSNFANLDIAKVEKRVEIADYQETIQTAFHDVSDALVSRDTYADQIAAQQALVAADQKNYDLSSMRFKAGIDAYLTVLVAEESLFSAKLNLIALQLSEQQNLVTLYKALGGGWKS
ncbi:efflux transporter outer membrane subunit [Acidisoma cellulosilytica]|uniref:Efflux transporter outer membrane subunit n=1 Tax=Acidisoma cellulosilyticum TaxID=2802395 RepID=A0A964E2F0_9PROT|nr:efflux transporter outer membrane subunit [Acidisoma cellulosilyticum]MCB8879540.1 efflux transporter outer membrane subunit [Acidisoma cellulosilyticum]